LPQGPRPVSPAVSVVVRTKDRPELLREALESLAAQTYRDFEVVVVNDSDAPLGKEVIDLDGLRIRVVWPGPPHGRARAANAGVNAAEGTWVAYLDDDDLFLPDHLETLVGTLEGQDRVQAAYTATLIVHQVRGEDGTYRETGREPVFEYPFDPERLIFSNTIPLLCLMHRRSLFLEAGRFDEAFDLYEDWDFLIRLSRLTRIERIEKVTTLYRTRDDTTNATSVSPWRGEISERVREALFRKHWKLHTPRAEMALVNLHEDEVVALSHREAAVRQSLVQSGQELEASRRSLAERDRLLDERDRLLAERDRLLTEQGHRLADVESALERERNDRAAERERARLEWERCEAERVDLAAALGRVREERDRFDATVTQMTNSLAWRLFTPWWKLRAFLEKK
jgi:O-antigen biosynthesis protein